MVAGVAGGSNNEVLTQGVYRINSDILLSRATTLLAREHVNGTDSLDRSTEAVEERRRKGKSLPGKSGNLKNARPRASLRLALD